MFRVDSVLRRSRTQVTDREFTVLDLSRENGLVAQAIIDARRKETLESQGHNRPEALVGTPSLPAAPEDKSDCRERTAISAWARRMNDQRPVGIGYLNTASKL